jgi:hypothetical protein
VFDREARRLIWPNDEDVTARVGTEAEINDRACW